jgi:hypothetical protein
MSGRSERARALLQAAYDIHVEQGGSRFFRAGPALDLAGAGHRVGMPPGTVAYDAAVEELEDQDAIEENAITARAVGGTHYIVTAHGRTLLGL